MGPSADTCSTSAERRRRGTQRIDLVAVISAAACDAADPGVSCVNHTELSHTVWSFVTSAGFGGAATFLAAVVAGGVALFSVRRTRLQHECQLAAQERDRRIARCWERLTWLASISFTSSADPGLAPDLVNELITELDKEAMDLDDDTLALAVAALGTQFLNMLQE